MARRSFLDKLLVLAAGVLDACNYQGFKPVERTVFNFCYYGGGEFLEEHKDHVTASWIFGWGPFDTYTNVLTQLTAAQKAGVKVILGLLELWGPAPEQDVRTLLTNLQTLGLLKNIWMLYPLDEPDKNGNITEIAAKNNLLRSIMKDYPELKDTKIGAIYGPSSKYPGLESFDIVGFDHYGTDITKELFNLLLLGPKEVMLVPGGCDPWQEKIEDFLELAKMSGRITTIVPFIWQDNPGPSRDWGPKGIRSNGLADSYRKAGLSIKESTNA